MPKISNTSRPFSDAGVNRRVLCKKGRQSPLSQANSFRLETWSERNFEADVAEHCPETKRFRKLVLAVIDFCEANSGSGGKLDKRFQHEAGLLFPSLPRRLLAELMRGVANRRAGRPSKNVPN
jgi:hypothetical protein